MLTKTIAELRVGDLIDLYGDPFADPERDPLTAFEFEYAEVAEVRRETPGCFAVMIEGFDLVGFPPDHVVRLAA